MNTDYMDLKALLSHRGYQKLQALWAHQFGRVMENLQKVAAKNNESNWRFQAGILRGFNLCVDELDRALLEMEKQGEANSPAAQTTEELLKELRGENNK